MEHEFELQLRSSNQEQLLQLMLSLVERYPLLRAEIINLLHNATNAESADESEEASEDWDFSGEEAEVPQPLVQQSRPLPFDEDVYRKRLANYDERLNNGESPQSITADLAEILEEAARRTGNRDYNVALTLYALIIDERLKDHVSSLAIILDEAIYIVTPVLATLLSESNNNDDVIEITTQKPSPLFSTSVRQAWIERLFTLWIRRLDARTVEDELQDILLNMTWSEDIHFLRQLIQNELQKQPAGQRSNIVDFTLQFKTRALEHFFKDLSFL